MRLVRSNSSSLITLEDLFVDKYEWLMGWALHFAQGDRSTAEDLVQDTFVRFAISHPELDDPQNAGALLYTYLKHVHLAHLRRLQRYPHQNLSIDEFDSISLGLRQNVSANPADVQNHLRRILAYLCWRKDTTKAASILILRFFFGFFPEEIARIALVSRPVVDNGLSAARKELKRHLSHDESAGVQQLRGAPAFRCSSEPLTTEQFLDEVRNTLGQWRTRSCLPAEELARRYRSEHSRPIECELLAHIVSCQRCLDMVTHSQEIPPVEGRSFDGALVERYNSRPPGRKLAFAKDSNLRRSLSIVRNRIQEVLEHEPRILTLVVNGHVVATQDVGSAICKQEVEINLGAPIELIEVMSEQGLCLLVMEVASTPPYTSPESHRRVSLSCGRTVEAWLRYTSTGSRVETSYSTPTLLKAAEVITVPHGANAASMAVAGLGPLQRESDKPKIWRLVWTRILTNVTTRFKEFALPDMTPIFAAALVLLAASLLCFAVWWNGSPHMTTDSLLERAQAWDKMTHQPGNPGVIYQAIRIKTPQRTVNRAIYRDAQGIRHPRRQELGAADVQLKESLAQAGVDWDEPLSASMYREWHDRQRIREDAITKASPHLLKLTTTVASGLIASESLTVAVTDFHPVARTIELRDADTVEIAEVSYEVLPWSAAGDDWFEPLATPVANLPVGPHVAHLPPAPRFASEMELDEAELETRLALHQLNADTSERIEVERGVNGVQVKGIVATSERKHEIESRLHRVPHVLSAIYTFQELQDRQSGASEVTSVRQASSSTAPSPLEAYLAGRGMNRAQVGELGIDLSNASITASQEGKAIEELLTQFGRNKELTPAAHATFDQLLADHKARMLSALKEEEQILARSGIAFASPDANPSNSQLISAMDRHRALSSELLSGNAANPRDAQTIAHELEQSLWRLRAILSNLSTPFAAPSTSTSSLPPNQNN